MGNLEKSSGNPVKAFCSTIENMVCWANKNGILKVFNRLSLEEYVDCFAGIEKKHFLTEKPLLKMLGKYLTLPGSLRKAIPNGICITLVANPCDQNGLELRPKYFNDETNQDYPYFKPLYSDSHDPRALAHGMGNLTPAPLLQLYPTELLLQCSFIVDYGQADTSSNDDDTEYADSAYLAKEITIAYSHLQSLLKGQL